MSLHHAVPKNPDGLDEFKNEPTEEYLELTRKLRSYNVPRWLFRVQFDDMTVRYDANKDLVAPHRTWPENEEVFTRTIAEYDDSDDSDSSSPEASSSKRKSPDIPKPWIALFEDSKEAIKWARRQSTFHSGVQVLEVNTARLDHSKVFKYEDIEGKLKIDRRKAFRPDYLVLFRISRVGMKVVWDGKKDMKEEKEGTETTDEMPPGKLELDSKDSKRSNWADNEVDVGKAARSE